MKHLLHKLSSLRLLMLLTVLFGMGSSTAWATTYKLTKVTSVSAGNKYVFEENSHVLSNSVSSKALQATDTYSTTGLAGTESYIWELETATGGFYLKNVSLKSNQYLNNASGKADMSFGAKSAVWSIVFTDDVALISNTSNSNRFLGNNGSDAYKAYATSNLGTYAHDFTVYLVEEEVLAFTITAQSNNNTYGTVSLDGAVITGSPNSGYRYASPAYTVTVGTATVAQSGDAFTVTPSSDCTVQINFEAIPTHTATFSVNGNITPQVFQEGADIEFPSNPSAISSKVFRGWVTTPIVGTTDEAPAFVNTATQTMGESNVTYYAVFAEVIEGEETDQSITIDANEHSAGFPTSYAASDNYTLSGKSFNITQAYDSGEKLQWRAAGNSKGTGTMYNNDALQNIQSIVLTYDAGDSNKNFSINIGDAANPTSGTSITPSTSGNVYTFDCSLYNKDYFVLTNGEYAGYLTSIVINYKTGTPDTYSAYCTTVVAAAVEKPAISVTSPFNFSTEVSMSCETGGATIYYTLDGTEPTSGSTEYSAPFDINATTTIKAIAIKGLDESGVTTVTATKQLAIPTVTVSGDLTLDLNGGTDVNAGTLTASVTYDEAPVGGATVTWSSSAPAVATIDAETGVVTLLTAGEVTFTATYAGNSDYAEKTGTRTVTVFDSKAPGSETNPYTVAQARAAIDAGTGITNVYATGIVSEIVTAYNPTYHNITYNISADGLTTSDQLQAFRGKSYDGDDFTSEDDIQVGDVVVVYGTLTKYSSTYEFTQNNQLVSLSRKPAATITVEGGTEFNIDRNNGEEELTLTATANSGATVVFTVDTENTTVNAEDYDFDEGYLLVSGNYSGVIIIKANAEAAGDYNAATEVTITVNVLGVKSEPTIVVQDENVEYGSTFTIDDSMIEGGAITVTSSNTVVATVSDLTITPAAVGTTIITVSTAETAEYKAGSETFELTVTAPAGKTEAPAGNTTLFAESFGNNTGSARNWNDSYSVKSGVAAVYSGITGYEVSNVKQGKNTTGSVKSGLNQSTQGTDAYIIIGPLNVADYSNMTLTYQWKAASIGATYSTSAFYKTSAEGEFTEIEGTGAGATTFVERSYAVPAAAQVSTLYLKIVWNTSNTQAIIDEVQLTTPSSSTEAVKLNSYGYATFCSVYPLDGTQTGDYSLWTVTDVEGTVITFTKVTGAFEGGQGVLVKGAADATVNIPSVDSDVELTGNLLIGTTAPTFVAAGAVYGLSGEAFVPSNAAGNIPAGKAYLTAASVSEAKALTFVFVDETTGITETRQATREEVESIFNLGGQRMSKLQRGINIVNGRKVLVK